MACLFSAELLLISARTPHAALQNAPGLPGIVFELGLWKVRLLVTLAVVCLLFWQVRGKEQARRLSAFTAGRAIQGRWLLAHVAAIFLFATLTAVLFENHLRGLAADLLVVGWAATGAAAVVLGALAILPASSWKTLLQGTRDVWGYVVVLVTVGCLLAAYATPVWQPLARWTLLLASFMLHPLVPGITVDMATRSFGTPRFMVEVAPACSGYEGIGLILAFTTAWLWFFRKEWRFPRALLLVPLGVATIWVFNAVRIAMLVLIGLWGSPDIAMQGFHSHAGWITFNVVALGTCLVARRTAWLTTGSVATSPAAPIAPNSTAVYLTPFLAILGAALIAGASSARFEWSYPLRIVAAAAALWYFRDRYRTLNWRVGWPSVGLGAVVFLIWIGLEPLFGSPHMAEPAALAQAPAVARIAWIAFRILGAVVTVPIAEELAFRGYLLRRLVSADFESVAWGAFAWAPFLISSVAFGVLHGERWLAGTIAGMIYAYAMLRRGRIGEAAAAHAVTNALLAVYVLFTGNWQLW
ncbi:MAG TPA: exosortase E/protease, VPEID-CTERM system [Bryobacteraceae bacterium]|nr:exosortase E/protease, VPEID-CTERM system [Bryobacteraceae bacterium]